MSSMNCPRCGRTWAGEVWQGLCPGCLARVALEGAGDDEGEPLSWEAAPNRVAAGSVPAVQAGAWIGDFELLEEIARGGMGVVYRARQAGMNRVVALKLLPAFPGAGRSGIVERFQREARASGALHHRHIVTVHAAGEWQGWLYLAMEYVEGGSLATAVRDRPPSIRRAAGWARAVADATALAHDRGIVHRDLKPSNVLLGRDGEPLVSDFGLSRWLSEDSELTLTGQVLGSPGYLPPERLSGQGEVSDVAGDVYGIGAVLYFLLCGRPPFVGADVESILIQALGGEVPRPRLFQPAIPADLEAVVLKCLEREPRRRFATAREVADELDRWLRGEVLRTRPAGWVRAAWRWCRRHAGWAWALGAVVASGVIGGGLTFWQWHRAEKHAEQLAATVLRLRLDQASERLENERSSEGLAMLARLLREDPANRVAAQRVVSALDQRTFLRPLPGELALPHARWINPFAQHGNRVVGATNGGRTVTVWNLERGLELEREIPVGGPARVTAFTRDGRGLAVVTEQGELTLHDLTDGSRRAGPHLVPGFAERVVVSPDGELALVASVPDLGSDNWRRLAGVAIRLADGQRVHADVAFHHAEYSPNGQWLVTSGGNFAVIRRAATWEAVGRPMRDGSRVYQAAFSPDSSRIVTAGADANASIWKTETGEWLHRLVHGVNVDYAFFSPDGRRVFTHEVSGNGRIWDASTGRLTGGPFPTSRSHGPASFSPDGSRFACDTMKELVVRDGVTGLPVSEAIAETESAALSRFLGDGSRVLVAAFPGRARVWSMTHAVRPSVFQDRLGLNGAAMSPDGTRVATANMGSRGRLYRAVDGVRPVAELVHQQAVTSVRWNAVGDRVLTVSVDGSARLWDGTTGQSVGSPLRHDGVVTSGRFSPDGRWVATGSEDRTVRFWDGRTGAAKGSPLQHDSQVHDLGFSPDGRHLATISRSRTLRVWSVPDGGKVMERAGSDLEGDQPVFHPNGLGVVTCGGSPVVRLRAWREGARIDREIRRTSVVRSVEFRSDGARFVLAEVGGTAQVLDTATFAPRGRPMRHAREVSWAGFSPDGRFVLTVSADGTGRIWDAETGHAVSDTLRHRDEVTTGEWAVDGRGVLTASRDRTAVRWPIWLVPDVPAPGWLPDLAEATAGLRQSGSDEQFEALPARELVIGHERLAGLRGTNAWGAWLSGRYAGAR